MIFSGLCSWFPEGDLCPTCCGTWVSSSSSCAQDIVAAIDRLQVYYSPLELQRWVADHDLVAVQDLVQTAEYPCNNWWIWVWAWVKTNTRAIFFLRQVLFFLVPGSMLSCFWFSASLLFCFSASCFSAFLLLCFSASASAFAFPAFLLSCFSAFMLLLFLPFCFSAFLLLCVSALCFPCFFAFLLLCLPCFSFSSAFVLLCLSTSTILSRLFSVMCFSAILPAPLLFLLFLLSLLFSFYFALFSPVCILNETLARP